MAKKDKGKELIDKLYKTAIAESRNNEAVLIITIPREGKNGVMRSVTNVNKRLAIGMMQTVIDDMLKGIVSN